MKSPEFIIEQIAVVDGHCSMNRNVSFKPLPEPRTYFPNTSMNEWNEYWKAAVEFIDSKIPAGSIVIIGTRSEMVAGTAELGRVGNRAYRTLIFDEAMTVADNDIIYLVHQHDPVGRYNLSRFF